MTQPPARFAILGFGRIGRRIARLRPDVAAVLVRPGQEDAARALLPGALIATTLDAVLATKPRMVVEVAGQALLRAAAVPVLRAGLDLVPLSLGAFCDDAFFAEASAAAGPGRLVIPPGTMGSLDLLGAARESGLTAVSYTSSRPPRGLARTLLKDRFDLDALTEATLVWSGTARDAGRDFPDNCNLTVGIALAGMGLDATRVEMIADPAAIRTTHRLTFSSGGSDGCLVVEAPPIPPGGDPADLAAFSILRLLRRWQDPVFV
ncbi:aspartate dehydrogenase domain-containing protein [Humitalea sp. 24SJ18S-53]|uniref:aspartate dehydrogenase domain-containing protein n=1 Tax=Humitalea sp. 24SJ18S-53 TaxID=3422307 RepID=UPI003D67B44B